MDEYQSFVQHFTGFGVARATPFTQQRAPRTASPTLFHGGNPHT